MYSSGTPELLHISGPEALRTRLSSGYEDTAHKHGSDWNFKNNGIKAGKDAERREVSCVADENVKR